MELPKIFSTGEVKSLKPYNVHLLELASFVIMDDVMYIHENAEAYISSNKVKTTSAVREVENEFGSFEKTYIPTISLDGVVVVLYSNILDEHKNEVRRIYNVNRSFNLDHYVQVKGFDVTSEELMENLSMEGGKQLLSFLGQAEEYEAAIFLKDIIDSGVSPYDHFCKLDEENFEKDVERIVKKYESKDV